MSTLQYIPIFESGYPLRVADLNLLFDNLDDGERHTRICLLGAGIFHGLEVTTTGRQITISAGVGVTSQGYLYCERTEKKLSKIKLLGTELSTSRYSSAYLTNTHGWMEGDLTTLMAKEPITPTPFDFTQVIELTETDGSDLATENLENRVLALVFERVSEKRSGCTTCNKGTNGKVNIRYFLFQNDEWGKLRLEQNVCPTVVKSSAQTTYFPYMMRLGVVENCTRTYDFSTMTEMNEAYKRVVNPALERLSMAFDGVLQTFSPIFRKKVEERQADTVIIETWKTRFVQNPDIILNQHKYDYVKHLIQAYTELVSKPFAQILTQLPAEKCFPKYLSLANFTKEPEAELTVKDESRLPFYRPPFVDSGVGFEEAKFLYERLIAMLDVQNLAFDRNATDEKASLPIRILPSRSAFSPLSNRSIPFYFVGEKLRPKWHFQLAKTGRTESIAIYEGNGDAPFEEPFLYQNAFDDADFYRISGHVGQKLNTVWQKLFGEEGGLRRCLNLPFSAVIVELNNNTEGGKPAFTMLEDFARKHTGLEHQGGVLRGGTLVLVVQRESVQIVSGDEQVRDLIDEQKKVLSQYSVVADFCLPYWVADEPRPMALAYFTIKNEAIEAGKLVNFENNSPENQLFEWFIDGRSVSKTRDLSFTFDFENEKDTERTFIVTLVAKLDEDDKLPDMATHGVKITRKVVVLEKPIANFQIIERQSIRDGEKIIFSSATSQHAKSFRWFVDNKEVSTADDLKTESFEFGDNALTERDFVITLIAYNKLNQLGDQDIEKLTVTIRRDAPLVITTDFDFIPELEISFGDKLQIEKSISDNGFAASFENLSQNASKYQWSIFLENTNEPINGTFAVSTNTAKIYPKTPFVFRVIDAESTTYIIQLISFDDNDSVFQKVEKKLTVFLNQINVNLNDGLAVDRPITDALTASRNIENRRRNYFKKLEDLGRGNPPLSNEVPFQNVLRFMADLDKAVDGFDRVPSLKKTFEKQDEFDKIFKTNVLACIQEVKKGGGLFVEDYQNVLRNLLFFYLDKLIHLLPEKLTQTTEQTLKEVLTKIKSEQCFAPETLIDLRQAWQASDITTAQNMTVAAQLNALFE